MIYLDNAATTKLCEKSAKKYFAISTEDYFNPSAVYGKAIAVKKEINKTRDIIADTLVVQSENILFTSGGTESNNLSILGSFNEKTKGRYICGACEHPSVYNVYQNLKSKGADVRFVKCNRFGRVDEEDYSDALDCEAVSLVSIMHVNNETGGINDIIKLSKQLKQRHPAAKFHCDGVQGFAKQRINLNSSNIDFYSFSAHKINAPKGVGGLYVKNLSALKPIVFGGGQENAYRSGTENTAGIIAAFDAIELWRNNCESYMQSFCEYKNIVIEHIRDLPKTEFYTDEHCACNILSLSADGIKGEVLLHMLETDGIIVGKGSACSSKNAVSRAHKEMGITSEGVIRLSFGIFNTKEDVEFAATKIRERIVELRNMMRR